MISTRILRFFSQHRTPVLPQVPVEAPRIVNNKMIRVGYFLSRNQVVKHNQHPLETEFAYALEREHQRYSRHENVESATHFLAARGQTMDTLNRSDSNAIEGNFYGLELYQDAMRVVLQRFAPEKRVTSHDLVKVTDEEWQKGPPVRHTLHRALDDFLYLIIKNEHGKWSIPYVERNDKESLRMTADRCLGLHGDTFDAYVWSNAPQAVLRSEAPPSSGADEVLTYVYNATYLAGRPKFEDLQCQDHAWVRRCELPQYLEVGFEIPNMLEVLMDISQDSTFDGAM